MKAAIIVFPGSNCDRDMYVALKQAMGSEPLMVWHKETNLPKVDLIAVPGGFSYGDYLRSGAIAAKSPIMQEVIKRANEGVYVLGVCNGFQILTETSLLEGTLRCNTGLKFLSKEVNLKVTNNQTIFSGGYQQEQVIKIPIAHHDGYYFAESDSLKSLEDNDQIIFKYCNELGEIDPKYCPNGAMNNIAGITNKNKNVLAMMPHPERACDALAGRTDGLLFFKNIIEKLS
jgi:phosphoribosylformylglycinamidine synthase subunit PurQ / glutaminase